MTARRLRIGAVAGGAVVIAVYVVAGALTLRVSGRHVRPLYDSFAGNAPYQWVCPPAGLRSGNLNPNPAQVSIGLTATGSASLTVTTDDGQMLFSMAQGEIPAHEEDTTVLARITPLCAAKLGAVPAGYSAAGNAYRYTLTYQPSGVAITTTTKPGDVLVKPPTTADAVAYSADNGRTWQLLRSFHSSSSIGASFSNPGIYLALLHGAGVAPSDSSGGSGAAPFVIGLAVAVVAAGLVALVEFIRRRR